MKKNIWIILGVVLVILAIIAKFLFLQGGTLMINQPVSASTNIEASLNVGTMTIDGTATINAITGQITYKGNKPNILSDSNSIRFSSTDNQKEERILHLPQNIGSITFALGNGNLDINSRNMQPQNISASVGNGNLTYTAPEQTASKATISVGNGNIYLNFPKKLDGIKLTFAPGTPVPEIDFKENVTRTSDGYETKGFIEGKINAEVRIGAGNAQLYIKTIE